MFKKEMIIIVIGAALGLIATILGIIALTKDVFGGVSLFDSSWSDWSDILPSSISTHRIIIIAFGAISLLIGSGTLGGLVYAGYKIYSNSSVSQTSIIILSILTLVSLILGSIAMSFSNDMNDAVWESGQANQHILDVLSGINK